MTPGAMRVLRELAEDEHRDLVREGIVAYCGPRRTKASVVTELIGCMAIKPAWPQEGPGARYYVINETGRAILRRPELEQELQLAVMGHDGPFQIVNDRIVKLKDPKRRRA